MTNNEKELLSALKDLRLSTNARTRTRAELVAYSELHAMPKKEQVSFNGLRFMSGILSHSRRVVGVAFALLLIVAIGGATTYAAEKALPNEPLYAVKVTVNEPALALFAGSGTAQAKLHATLAVRRVAEAEALRQKGALTPDTEASLTKQFSTEADKALVEADKLESSGDVSTSLAVRTELTDSLHTYITVSEDADVPSSTALPLQVSAVKATLMMTKQQPESDKPPAPKRSLLQSAIAKKIVEIDTKRTREHAQAVTDNDKDTRDTDKGDRPAHRTKARSLLSGSSVLDANDTPKESSSTPASAKELIKNGTETPTEPPAVLVPKSIQTTVEDAVQKVPSIVSPLSL